jgi:hypothetical protein
MKADTIKTLRDRQPVTFFKKIDGYAQKIFIRFRLNKEEKFICWQMFYSLDRKNWNEQNRYMSLKDINVFISKH